MEHENNTDVRVVRHVGGSILGQAEAGLVPLSITDDRIEAGDWDWLKANADLVVTQESK